MEPRETLTMVTDNGKEVGSGDVLGRDSVRVVHLTIPSSTVAQQMHHPVIQTSSGGVHLSTTKGNVILLNKAGGFLSSGTAPTFHNIQVLDPASLSGGADDGSGGATVQMHYVDAASADNGGALTLAARGRREQLSRRPSYRRILNELGGAVSEDKAEHAGGDEVVTSAAAAAGIIKVVPASALQLAGTDTVAVSNISVLAAGGTCSGGNGSSHGSVSLAQSTGGVVQYAQHTDGQYFLPVSIPVSSSVKLDHEPQNHRQMVISASGEIIEEVTKKREIRLLKNREAAKECRRKKKEYIKCLENRVAVLENQNKALIEELKSLKELYCQKR